MTDGRRVWLADLGVSQPREWTVWVPAPTGWLLQGEERDPQDEFRWRHAAAQAVEAAEVPRLRATKVRAEIVSSVDDPVLPRHQVPALQGRLLATARECQRGVVDVCGEITGPASVTMGPRRLSPGVVLHITGEPS